MAITPALGASTNVGDSHDIVHEAARALASAASCFLQCADVAVGDDRRSCQAHLWEAVTKMREVLDA